MDRHVMFLEETHPSGAQTWQCTSCSRRFVLRWYPDQKLLKRISLIEGEHTLPHTISMVEDVGEASLEEPPPPDSDTIERWREMAGSS